MYYLSMSSRNERTEARVTWKPWQRWYTHEVAIVQQMPPLQRKVDPSFDEEEAQFRNTLLYKK